jgi:ribosomal-protein-alanine N-acetyltransferase
MADHPGTSSIPDLLTARLRLVAASPLLLRAEMASAQALAAALGADLPATWPPELFEADDIERSLALAEQPGTGGFNLWYLVTRQALGGRGRGLLAGVAGFGGLPDEAGVATLGYSVVTEARRRGFASEAVEALVAFAFADPRTRQLAAETFETLIPSIGVLERCHFRREGEAITPGAIRFVRHRPPAPG